MIELKQNEIAAVSGGDGEGLVVGVIVGLCVLALIGSSSCHYEYQPYQYTISNPVYDASGTWIGNQVDTYVDYKLVYVC